MRYWFGQFVFDDEALELMRGAEPVDVQPQALEMLRYLIENRQRLVSKDELIEALWGGRAVSDDAVTKRIYLVREALDDNGPVKTYVRSIYGKGVRFVAEVTEGQAEPAAAQSAPASPVFDKRAEPVGAHRGARPSIAVLPLSLVGVAPHHAALPQALSDDIINALGRLRWLFVIARGSSFRFSSHDYDLDRIRMDLGARYCLSGRIEVSGEEAIVCVVLADTSTGGEVWNEEYRLPLGDIRAVRQEVVSQIVSTLDVEISAHEAELALEKPLHSLTAWESYHLGLSKVFDFGPIDANTALEHFHRATVLEPRFARAYAGIAYSNWLLAVAASQEERGPLEMATVASAQLALELDNRDPFVRTTAGRAHFAVGEIPDARFNFEAAIKRAPSYVHAYAALGGLECMGGDPEAGIESNRIALSLSPLDPNIMQVYGTQICGSLRVGDTQGAADWADRVRRPERMPVAILSAALMAYHAAGRKEQAKDTATKLRALSSGVNAETVIRSLPVLVPELREIIHESFAENGL